MSLTSASSVVFGTHNEYYDPVNRVCLIIGMVMLIVALWAAVIPKFLWNRSAPGWAAATAMLSIIFIAGPLRLVSFMVNAMSSTEGKSTNLKTVLKPISSSPVTPAAHHSSGLHVNWFYVGSGVVVIACLVLAAVLGVKIARVRNGNSSRKDRWAAALRLRDAVLTEYGKYEFDIQKSFQYPLVHDVRNPKTAAFLNALAEATHLWPNAENTDLRCPRKDSSVDEYLVAVRRLETAWKIARDNAIAVELNELPLKYRRNITRAIKILTMANDPAETAEARANYLHTAMTLVAEAVVVGLLVVPDKAREALEAPFRLAITDGLSNPVVIKEVVQPTPLARARKQASTVLHKLGSRQPVHTG